MTETEDVAYLTGADVFRFWGIEGDQVLTMDRYAPDGEGPWPVVVMLHGHRGSSQDMRQLARAVSERGVLVYAPDYLYDMYPQSIDQIESGLWLGETALGDLRCAMWAIQEDAVSHGGDPEHVVLLGHSLGGTLGATITLAGDDPDVAPGTSGTCVAAAGSAVPEAFIDLEGLNDWVGFAEAVEDTLYEAAPEVHADLSPLTHTGRVPDPPIHFHLVSGDASLTEPYDTYADHMEVFAEALQEAGHEVSTTLLPGIGHIGVAQPEIAPEVVELIIDLAYLQSE